MVITKNRFGHRCEFAWIVVGIVVWDGVDEETASRTYSTMKDTIGPYGEATERKCGFNDPNTCACQGIDDNAGASFSFGCSYSMFYNLCKFAKSRKDINKFKLTKGCQEEERNVEDTLQKLATDLAPLYERVAPDSYGNQVASEKFARHCRLGLKPGRPFSGVTAVADFCAHAHKDTHNVNAGCTVVVTLLKPENRAFGTPVEDEVWTVSIDGALGRKSLLTSSSSASSASGTSDKVARSTVFLPRVPAFTSER